MDRAKSRPVVHLEAGRETRVKMIDQQLIVNVLIEAKNHLVEVQNRIERSETESERAALVKAADELKRVIERNLT